MIPDLNFVREAFSLFNTGIFGGELPAPRFALSRGRTFRGKMCWSERRSLTGVRTRDFEMRISIGFDLPREEWEDVVIHEMIHYYIAFKRIKDSSSHGPVFRRMMADINRIHGRKIVVSSRQTKEQADADRRVRGHYLCLVKMSDGRLGLAPVAKSRIFILWDEFNSFPGAVAVKWVGSTDPWFNRFPRVLTPRLYVADRGEVAAHLKGALMLVREGGTVRALSSRHTPDELLP